MFSGFNSHLAGLAPGSPFVSAGGMNFNDPQGSYNKAYSAAAATNQNLYSQYMQMAAAQQAQAAASLAANQRQYGQLKRQVVGTLAGSNRANIQDINDKYVGFWGKMQQTLIDRGLGNTSAVASIGRGVMGDRAAEVTRSQGEFARLIAGAQSQIGLAGLQAGMSGIGMMAGLQGDQLRYLASINAPYPDVGAFAAMGGGGGPNPFTMPGMPGPAPSLGPVGGYTPNIFGSPAGMVDLTGGGGGYGGGYEWATGYNVPNWNVPSYGGGYGGGGIIAAMASAGAGAYDTAFGGYGGGGDF